jgi:hypothetical protein
MFHNTLVVGSSPTSSTTQSPPTGESRLVQNAPFFIGAGVFRWQLRPRAQAAPSCLQRH